MLPRTFFSFLLIAVISALLSYRFMPAIRQILIAALLVFITINALWFWMRSTRKPGLSILVGLLIFILLIVGVAYLVYWNEKNF